MSGLLEGRVSIVTGAGRGIGASVARLLAAEGAQVVVNDLGVSVDGTGADKSPAQQVVDDIKAAGGEAVVNADDVADFQSGEAIIRQAIDTYGRLDVLVSNAGIMPVSPFDEHCVDDWEAMVDVNVKGALLGAMAAAPAL